MIFRQGLWLLMHLLLQLSYLLVKKFLFNFLFVKFLSVKLTLLIHRLLLMMNILRKFHLGLIVAHRYMMLQKYFTSLIYFLEELEMDLLVKHFINYAIIYLAQWLL